MAATPTTKSQVQAYRFVLRRMEHALVRKDAVMLHDPWQNTILLQVGPAPTERAQVLAADVVARH